jgi:hypothetical protein
MAARNRTGIELPAISLLAQSGSRSPHVTKRPTSVETAGRQRALHTYLAEASRNLWLRESNSKPSVGLGTTHPDLVQSNGRHGRPPLGRDHLKEEGLPKLIRPLSYDASNDEADACSQIAFRLIHARAAAPRAVRRSTVLNAAFLAG